MPVDAGVSIVANNHPLQLKSPSTDIQKTTAGKSDRPALKEDNLAATNSGIPNSKL